MPTVHNKHCLCFSTTGSIYCHSIILCILYHSLYWCSFCSNYRNHPVCIYNITIAYTNISAQTTHPLYSIFWICSLIFSISVFKSIALFEISISFALESIVFASRFISWVIKSNLRPTFSPTSMVFCKFII